MGSGLTQVSHCVVGSGLTQVSHCVVGSGLTKSIANCFQSAVCLPFPANFTVAGAMKAAEATVTMFSRYFCICESCSILVLQSRTYDRDRPCRHSLSSRASTVFVVFQYL